MFRAIRQVFFRIRVFFGALRAGILGLAAVGAGWIFLAPPSATEAALLDLPQETSSFNGELRAHRMAKLLTVVGTDQIYEMVASRVGNGLTADMVRQNVDAVATGAPSQVVVTTQSVAIAESSRLLYIEDETPDIDQIQKNAVRAGGAKFVTARTD